MGAKGDLAPNLQNSHASKFCCGEMLIWLILGEFYAYKATRVSIFSKKICFSKTCHAMIDHVTYTKL